MNSLEFEQQASKTLAEIGAQLRDVRHQKGMALDEISAQTLIPTRLLTAIEEGQVEELPELIYTRGMIRRFANTLGLNGAKLVSELGGGKPAPKNLVKKSKKRSSGSGLRPIHLYVLYIFIILAAGSGLSYMINQSALTLEGGNAASTSEKTDETTASSKPPSGIADSSSKTNASVAAPTATSTPRAVPVNDLPVAPSPQVEASQTVESSSVATEERPPIASEAAPAAQPSSSPLRIDLSLRQDAWVEIVVDGKPSYSGTLTAGTNRTVTAQKKLVLKSGNAGGVMVAINQQPAQLMGKPGAIKTIVLEPEAESSQATTPDASAEG